MGAEGTNAAEPRVTHFHDCAMVGRCLVEAAARAGLHWNYIPPEQVRPAEGFGTSARDRIIALPYVFRHWNMLRTSDVIQINYAMTHHLLQHGFMPQRPYVLYLLGSDIRRQWQEPGTHDVVQRAVDGAHTVFYCNLDTAENALAARSDARYLPASMDAGRLPPWRAGKADGKRRIIFSSRWDDTKGVETQLELARRLRQAHPDDVEIAGLNWGPEASRAESLGVRIVPRMAHADYVDFLASADMVMGQSSGVLANSELEAMAIGPVVACPVVSEYFAPGAPIIQGSVEDVVEASLEVLRDPRAASERMNARPWVVEHHSPDQQIPMLQAVYRDAARS